MLSPFWKIYKQYYLLHITFKHSNQNLYIASYQNFSFLRNYFDIKTYSSLHTFPMMLPTSCKKKTKNNTSLIKKLTFNYLLINKRYQLQNLTFFFSKSSIVVISIKNITLKTIQINQLMDQKTEIVHSSTSIIWLFVQINHISLKKNQCSAFNDFNYTYFNFLTLQSYKGFCKMIN